MNANKQPKHTAQIIPFAPRGCTGASIESDLALIARSRHEIECSELTEAVILSRVGTLRTALSACRSELANGPDNVLDLHPSVDAIVEELSSFEQTLPLECAFLADQRDRALGRMTEAQDRLRQYLSVNFATDDVDMLARIQGALRFFPANEDGATARQLG